MRRWQEGDGAAFEALVRRWEQPVARFLGRLAGASGSVPDLCQEVFLRVYQAGPRYRETGAFSTWLYRIALNVARDAGRRNRRPHQPLKDREPAAVTESAETACERRELAQAVAQALAELPGPLREVLVLRHYEGMSFEHMARLLRTPASTLKSRFAAALTHMRRSLRQLGWGQEEVR
jgi:RNA polymerase sigma-70 factor (ECF subfamily)